jgi:hypothetical protein
MHRQDHRRLGDGGSPPSPASRAWNPPALRARPPRVPRESAGTTRRRNLGGISWYSPEERSDANGYSPLSTEEGKSTRDSAANNAAVPRLVFPRVGKVADRAKQTDVD